jgi:hypothetical protein
MPPCCFCNKALRQYRVWSDWDTRASHYACWKKEQLLWQQREAMKPGGWGTALLAEYTQKAAENQRPLVCPFPEQERSKGNRCDQ